MLLDVAGYANRACLGKAFQPRGNIHAVTEKIVAIDHHVAQADPNPENYSLLLGHVGIEFGHGTLDIDSEPGRGTTVTIRLPTTGLQRRGPPPMRGATVRTRGEAKES